MSHPCLTCGACCATFRVGFHWSETDPALGGTVPAELTEPLDPHRVAMRGTWSATPRCIALDAEIGVRARCGIHAVKPSVCREVPASYEFGAPSPQCDKARRLHGLPVLAPEDWLDVEAVITLVPPAMPARAALDAPAPMPVTDAMDAPARFAATGPCTGPSPGGFASSGIEIARTDPSPADPGAGDVPPDPL